MTKKLNARGSLSKGERSVTAQIINNREWLCPPPFRRASLTRPRMDCYRFVRRLGYSLVLLNYSVPNSSFNLAQTIPRSASVRHRTLGIANRKSSGCLHFMKANVSVNSIKKLASFTKQFQNRINFLTTSGAKT